MTTQPEGCDYLLARNVPNHSYSTFLCFSRAKSLPAPLVRDQTLHLQDKHSSLSLHLPILHY